MSEIVRLVGRKRKPSATSAEGIMLKFKKAKPSQSIPRPRLHPEKKEVVTFLDSQSAESQTPTYIVQLLNGVATGTDTNARVGRKISHQYIDIKIAIKQTAATAGSEAGFWAIVLDRQSNGAAPAFTDIFDTSVVTRGAFAPRNTLSFQDRFKILLMRQYAINTGTGGTPPAMFQEFVDMSKLKGLDGQANFGGTGATVASINSGAIYLVVASAFAQAASPALVTCGVKYRFMDM